MVYSYDSRLKRQHMLTSSRTARDRAQGTLSAEIVDLKYTRIQSIYVRDEEPSDRGLVSPSIE